ncbi:hypothetical protein BN14_05384 [Rhizoctonia solani AG-1 IB]|uniref:DUF6534 domain-containing protein n=1 Tax=Thanatephorus cucumeris (strain AG1-IB / isolate 7/3/14) TaxID=1108050 RepID=M5BVV0_THACB|nr:hypothetical protein BN14_05384 [Rhizoctonia solani AG-1 IB]
MYQGLFNSSYVPSPFEMAYIRDPVNLLGPWFCAVVFSLMLTGVILAQTYNYVEERPKDPFLLQLLHLHAAKSASTLAITWRLFIKYFGDFLNVGIPAVDQKITTVWGSFMGLIVQAYFIHRGFILSRNWYFLVAASLASIIGFVGSIILCYVVFTLKGIPPPLYLQSANMMVIGTVVADALITGFTCWYLLNQRKQSSFASTNTLIVRLITTSMQSAVPPLVCAIFNLIFNSRSNATDNAWVLCFNVLLPYFYVVSLMFTVNSRTRLRATGGSQSDRANIYGMNSLPKTTRNPEGTERATTQVYVTTQTRTDQINSAERGHISGDRRSVDSSSHISVGDKKRRLEDDF